MKRWTWAVVAAVVLTLALPVLGQIGPWTRNTDGKPYSCVNVSAGISVPSKHPTSAGSTTIECDAHTLYDKFLATVQGTAYALSIPLHLVRNADGSYRTANPAGDADPQPATLFCDDSAYTYPSLSGLIVNTNSVSENQRARLTGTGAAAATIAIFPVSGDDPAVNGFSISGDNLVNAGTDSDLPGSGSFKVSATSGGATCYLKTRNWSFVAAPATDTTAPNPVTGIISGTPGATTVPLLFDATVDPNDAVERTGVTDYKIYRNGVYLDHLTAATPGLVNDWTCANVGSPMGALSATQTGASWSGTWGGAGTEGTADSFYACTLPVSGATTTVISKVSSCPNAATYNKCNVIELCSSNDPNAACADAQIVRIADTYYIGVRNRNVIGATRFSVIPTVSIGSVIPPYLRLDYTASVQSVGYSFDGGAWTTALSNYASVVLPDAKTARFFATPTSDGATMSVSFDYVTVQSAGVLTKTVTPGAGSATFTVTATDGTNESAALAGVVTAPTAPAATAIKWHPGHYLQCCRSKQNNYYPDPTTALNTRLAIYDAGVKNYANVKGAGPFIEWVVMEGAAGDYTAGIARIRTEIDHLKNYATPKRYVLHTLDESSPGDNRLFPTYLVNAGCTIVQPTSLRGWWRMWDPTCRTYFKNMLAAYGAAFDSDPYFEGIVIHQETAGAYEVATAAGDTTFSNAAYDTGTRDIMLAARQAFPTSNVLLANNYLVSKAVTAATTAYLSSIGVGFFSPDTCAPGGANQPSYAGCFPYADQTVMGAAGYGGHDYRAEIPIWGGVELSEMGYDACCGPKPGGYSSLEVFTWQENSLHSSSVFWDYNPGYIGVANQWWTGANGQIATINANPLTHTACPTRYDTLFGDGSAGSGCNTN